MGQSGILGFREQPLGALVLRPDCHAAQQDRAGLLASAGMKYLQAGPHLGMPVSLWVVLLWVVPLWMVPLWVQDDPLSHTGPCCQS